MKYQQAIKTNPKRATQSSAKPMLSRCSPIHPLLQLQQTIGNRAVSRFLQAKLKVSEPGDKYEQEADRVADEVMRMPEPPISRAREWQGRQGEGEAATLQRKCAACASGQGLCPKCAEEEERMQRKPLAAQITPFLQRQAMEEPDAKKAPAGSRSIEGEESVPPIVYEVLRSPGQPLDAATRAFFESRFGHDFSRVRVHTDGRAADSARAVNAHAYTVGRDVVFAAGHYQPRTGKGRRLLGHELTHVMQESSSVLHASPALVTMGEPGDAYEREADAMATQVGSGKAVEVPLVRKLNKGVSSGAVSLRRQAGANEPSDGRPGCTVGVGISNSTCSAYFANSWWLPFAYVNNATCACRETPNVPTANCVRKFLQDRLAATPGWLKTAAALQKPNDDPLLPTYPVYQAFVQTFLTPRINRDHVDAYAACCCPSGPAAYLDWIGVTTVPLPCAVVGAAIRRFGSCHGTPGAW